MLIPTTIKMNRIACGFCSTGGRHDLCPGGVLNGDRTTLVLCACKEHDQVIRCLACGHTGPEVDDTIWNCRDQEACTAHKEKWAMDSIRSLYGDPELLPDTHTTKQVAKVKEPKRAVTGTCLCCGETTGGGLFRPGHDSKYLTRAVESIKGGKYTLQDVKDLMTAQGISEALQAKLAKRVA